MSASELTIGAWQSAPTIGAWQTGIVTVQTPVILPTSGEYVASQAISMSCGTSGANIYYTVDGSTPDAGDILYSIPFPLSVAKTIKAIGIKTGFNNSEVANEVYTITEIPQQPIITIII